MTELSNVQPESRAETLLVAPDKIAKVRDLGLTLRGVTEVSDLRPPSARPDLGKEPATDE